MPNYVFSYVRFEKMNKAAEEKFALLQQRLTENKNFSDLMLDGSVSLDETHTRAWQHEYIGPKWTTIEDIDESGMTLTSAWSAPTEGVEWLINELTQVDPELITVYGYEEEQPAFFGAYVYEGNEIYDGYEDEWDDIVYLVSEEYEDFANGKDEDGEFTDEAWDIFHENVWELLNNNAEEFISTTLKSLLGADDE